MPEPDFLAYAFQYTDTARQSRKDLPQEMLRALLDVIDMLTENPDSRPDRTRAVSRDGKIRVYSHPEPPLQVTYEVDPEKRIIYLLNFVAMRMQVTQPVFISYCHVDAEWLTKLKMFLLPLEKQNLIRLWDDTVITPGVDWRKEIRRALESARVAVFLVTQNFLTSQFINETELPPLLEKAKDGGCQIFWIAVGRSTYKDSIIERYEAANDPARPLNTLPEPEQEQVFVEIFERMKRAIEAS
jgi:mRNA-degrading endonuclease RelE of RelBE toxin-antitoxin system